MTMDGGPSGDQFLGKRWATNLLGAGGCDGDRRRRLESVERLDTLTTDGRVKMLPDGARWFNGLQEVFLSAGTAAVSAPGKSTMAASEEEEEKRKLQQPRNYPAPEWVVAVAAKQWGATEESGKKGKNKIVAKHVPNGTVLSSSYVIVAETAVVVAIFDMCRDSQSAELAVILYRICSLQFGC